MWDRLKFSHCLTLERKWPDCPAHNHLTSICTRWNRPHTDLKFMNASEQCSDASPKSSKNYSASRNLAINPKIFSQVRSERFITWFQWNYPCKTSSIFNRTETKSFYSGPHQILLMLIAHGLGRERDSQVRFRLCATEYPSEEVKSHSSSHQNYHEPKLPLD